MHPQGCQAAVTVQWRHFDDLMEASGGRTDEWVEQAENRWTNRKPARVWNCTFKEASNICRLQLALLPILTVSSRPGRTIAESNASNLLVVASSITETGREEEGESEANEEEKEEEEEEEEEEEVEEEEEDVSGVNMEVAAAVVESRPSISVSNTASRRSAALPPPLPGVPSFSEASILKG